MSAQSNPSSGPHPQSAPIRDLSGARDVVQAWIRAFNAADIQALVDLYEADAVLFPTGRPTPLAGISAIQDYFTNVSWDSAAVEHSSETMARALSETACVIAGLYDFSRLENGTRAVLPARYTMVLVRGAAGWRIAHHHSSATPNPR